MRAVVFSEYGSPDRLQLQEIERPEPEGNEVLVRVCAVSLNEWDWGALHGTPWINRMIFGWTRPKKRILGSDVAGRVEAVGRNVKKYKTGDAVFGDLSGTWGGFAEYVCAREDTIRLKPPTMTFEQAAAIPQAGLLALQGLDKATLQTGQRLLINGAGGGVGTFAVQLAKQFDSEITVVDRGSKLDALQQLGAHHAVDYNKEDFTKRGKTYDVILDVRTDRSAFSYLAALRSGGVYITVGGSLPRLLQIFLFGRLISLVSRKRMQVLALKVNKGLERMSEYFEAGKVVPVIDHVFDLSEVANAFRYYEEGKFFGKIVIRVAGDGG